MKDFIKIAVAVLILAAAVPMRAQEWQKVNDTTYMRQFTQVNGVLTEYAETLDMVKWNTKLNNDMRSAALFHAGAIGCGVASAAFGLVSLSGSGRRKGANIASLVLLAAGLGLEITGTVYLHQNRVYLTPEGVAIRISRTERSYHNKPDKGG